MNQISGIFLPSIFFGRIITQYITMAPNIVVHLECVGINEYPISNMNQWSVKDIENKTFLTGNFKQNQSCLFRCFPILSPVTQSIFGQFLSSHIGHETKKIFQNLFVKHILICLRYLERYRVRKKCPACLLYTSPSPRDLSTSRMPSSA